MVPYLLVKKFIHVGPRCNLEEFEQEALSVGLYITFVWSVISYEVVKMYPPMRERYLWILKTSVKLHPELYSCE